MNETGFRRTLPDQFSGSGPTFDTPRHPSVIDPILSKRVCFYKSGDPQFSGLRMVINNRTFKTFDALLDSLSKKVPLPFGVRNITTPRGIHGIRTLEELEDGKSYICSDSRKVKPINLALARKKPPPWYHARPLSPGQRAVPLARFLPGRGVRRQGPTAVRTPRRLVVYRNGDPSVKHTVVLPKKTVAGYESILDHISELMQFHVIKLHTPDGRRIDGLPGLILCSGIVVAVGREPFRPAVYSEEKSPVPAGQNTKAVRLRKQKTLNRKKKSPSHSSKSRNFSASSERFIVHQIHNTVARSSNELPSHGTTSAELDSNLILESVAETGEDACLGDGAQVQDEDNIEKSFRVNQDGSMTVEMKVRLTIKEEETVHWTTTLTRSSIADQLNDACLTEPEEEQEICSSNSNSLRSQSPSASTDTTNNGKNKDHDDDDPPSLGNGAMGDSGQGEEDTKNHTDALSLKRAPTPGYKRVSKQQASVRSIKSVAGDGVQEGLVGSYSYSEQTGNGTMTEEYCMVKQSTTRPVPKPRRFASADANSRNMSAFQFEEQPERLREESSGEEVTETILHIYEQQTCQDNLQANVSAHSMSASRVGFGRPLTSETGQLSSNSESELQRLRPSTASESTRIWRAESMTVTSDSHLESVKASTRQQLQRVTKGRIKPQLKANTKDQLVSFQPNVTNKHARKARIPRKPQKGHSAEAADTRTKAKTFSSAGFIKKIYGQKSKSAKSMKRFKKKPVQNREQPALDATLKTVTDSDSPSGFKQKTSSRVSFETNQMRAPSASTEEVGPSRGILKHQTSMRLENKSETESLDISQSMPLPAFNSSGSVTKEYVKSWLERANRSPPFYVDEKSKKLEVVTHAHTENVRHDDSENKQSLVTAANGAGGAPEASESLASVKLRVRSFESKSSLSVEKTPLGQKSHDTAHTEKSNSVSRKNSQEANPREVGNPVRIPSATLTDTLSMEQQPPPPERLNTGHCTIDAPPVSSSASYKLSPIGGQRSDKHPLPVGPASEKEKLPADNTLEKTSAQTDTPATPQLSRTPSTKRAPLVSNHSLERKMSLRRACVDKYTLADDSDEETPTSPTTDNICPGESHQPTKVQPQESQPSDLDLMCTASLCTSASPGSLTSEERMSSDSLSSSELVSKERKLNNRNQEEPPSPKTPVKRAQPGSSPSPERKSPKKSPTKLHSNSPKLPPVQSQPVDKTLPPNIGSQKRATPNSSPAIDRKHPRAKVQQGASPYSQSLDIASPPVRHKPNKLLPRNISFDSPLEPTSNEQKKPSSQTCSQETPRSGESTAEPDKAFTCDVLTPLGADERHECKEQDGSDVQVIPYQLNTAEQPNLKPVLEKICYSIKSIRRITQSKRPSCLEKSNSLPDFSSHVASTFGSSSKALLAFLSVMTLKEGLNNLNVDELNASHVSCAEALKMIDSLREIASIEDSHTLKTSLTNLQQSASKHILQSWKGFQEFSERCRSRSSTPNASEPDLRIETGPEQNYDIEGNVINEIMDNLDIPVKLKEELASLSDAENDGNMSYMITERLELSAKEESHEIIKYHPSEDAVSQDEKANTDLQINVKKITDISQPDSEMGSLNVLTDLADLKQSDHTSKEQKCPDLRDSVTERPPAEPKQTPRDSHPHGTISREDVVHQENQHHLTQQQGHKDKKSTQEKGPIDTDVRSTQNIKRDRCGVSTEEQDMDRGQLQVQHEQNTPQSKFYHEEESDSDEEEQEVSTANKDLNRKESLGPDSDEEYAEVEREGIKQESDEGEDLSRPQSDPEQDEIQAGSRNTVEENDMGRKSIGHLVSESQHLSECETPEGQTETASVGPDTSSDVSTRGSDPEEPSSDEEQPAVDSKKLQVIPEESLSGTEEEQEEEHCHILPKFGEQTKKGRSLEALIEETEVSSEDGSLTDEAPKSQSTFTSNVTENLVILSKNSQNHGSSLIISDSLEKDSRFKADDDSGKDHSSCEEDEEQLQGKDDRIRDSTEVELSYSEKESSSDEDQGTYLEETFTPHREAPVTTQPKATYFDKVMAKLMQSPVEVPTHSVAERVILLEKQVADSQKAKLTPQSSTVGRPSQRKAQPESDEDSASESPAHEAAICTRSAPPSSLSFSYDSGGAVTTEPEGRVRSIREMFLARSATNIQQRHVPGADECQLRAETSGSGGYQSQTSGELSSGEDDTVRKSIAKGFVRRTIELLYGKKDTKPEEPSKRPPSAPNNTKKEHLSIFSPFHAVRSKAGSEMSYFSSSDALDAFSEATRCIAFHAQVGPVDTVPIDKAQWLLRENILMRKSVSDPVGINKSFSSTPPDEGLCKDTEEKSPYSLFSSKSEPDDVASPGKCTYFSLPHANDSEVGLDEQSTVSRGSGNGDSLAEDREPPGDTKMWAERNGILPGIPITDFKVKDNKVHPLIEFPPDGEVVLVQPGKGHGVVQRRLPEPDLLDLMYHFCGEHCPIL
ncbi:uncharacterized protein ACNS7B_022914 [Menidia menidia]